MKIDQEVKASSMPIVTLFVGLGQLLFFLYLLYGTDAIANLRGVRRGESLPTQGALSELMTDLDSSSIDQSIDQAISPCFASIDMAKCLRALLKNKGNITSAPVGDASKIQSVSMKP